MNEKQRWIKDTQEFQRIARVTVSSEQELADEWDSFKTKKRRQREVQRIADHRIIQDQAIAAGKARRN